MSALHIPPMLWLVGFQMGLYAVAWVLCGALLGRDRPAVVHWGLFLLLVGAVMLLAAARGEPREWWFYNGSNVLSLVAFAVMRRGTELFMRLKPSDLELLLVLAVVGGAVGAVGPGVEHASWRITLTYGGQCFIVLRTMLRVAGPLRAEFGTRTWWAIIGPGLLISAMLAALALKQALDFSHPMEMQRSNDANYALVFYYLGGTALFNYGFMVMLTQRLVVALRHASQRDALTGLYNRRAMDEELARQWQRHRRHHHGFAVLLIDIDHFKRINDGNGHAVGDEVLAQVAQRLQSQARTVDTVSRMGGEEFLVLLPDTNAEEAWHLAERLRAVVQDEPVRLPQGSLAATVSIGAAVVHADDERVERVVARADQALYRAKAAGRNRSEAAEPDRSAPLPQAAA